jgi:hypothetical protein
MDNPNNFEQSAPAEPSGRPEAGEELACVAYFLYPDEAQIAQSVLESAGIPCVQPDANTLDVARHWGHFPGGRRLLVPESYLDQARELLAPAIAEANKTIVTHWFDQVWNENLEETARDFGAAADPILRSRLAGLHVAIEEMIAEANKVAVRITISGTHKGEAVQFQGVVILRIEGGRIVDTWAMNDAPEGLIADS